MKQKMIISENQLKGIISEAVNSYLNEGCDDCISALSYACDAFRSAIKLISMGREGEARDVCVQAHARCQSVLNGSL